MITAATSTTVAVPVIATGTVVTFLIGIIVGIIIALRVRR